MPDLEIQLQRGVVPDKMEMLASAINQTHEVAERCAQTAVECALHCGRLLIEAKATCGHGNWLAWVADNCRFSERQAQRYMELANRLSELEAKATRVSDLSQRQALVMLAESEYQPPTNPITWWDFEETKREHQELLEQEACRSERRAKARAEAKAWQKQREEEERQIRLATPISDEELARMIDPPSELSTLQTIQTHWNEELPIAMEQLKELDSIRNAGSLAGIDHWFEKLLKLRNGLCALELRCGMAVGGLLNWQKGQDELCIRLAKMREAELDNRLEGVLRERS